MKTKKLIQYIFIAFNAIYCCLFFSCRTTRIAEEEHLSRLIDAHGIKSQKQLVSFFMDCHPEADRDMVSRIASYYIEECNTEGINSDVAFVQMCLETGFLHFGNLVTPDMHNYCGLGAINEEQRGERFKTEQEGVRAHVQHLHAYGVSDRKLVNKLIDPRFKYVIPKGKSPTIFGLAGTWAADKQYGEKIDKLLARLEQF